MDVSIVIVNWNARDMLRDCLRSIYDETRDIEFEVIVVDNSSTDGSVPAIRSAFPHVTMIESPDNLGFAAGNNEGIRHATGKYILLLNPDTLIIECAIQKAFAYAEAHPDVGVLGCKVWSSDQTLQGTTPMYPRLLNLLFSITGLSALFPYDRLFGRAMMRWWSHNDTRPVEAVAGCFMFTRKSALEYVGPMDERFFMYAEEIDWCRRFTRLGWKVVYFHEAAIIHFIGQSSKLSERDMQVERRKSLLKYYRKHRGMFLESVASSLFALGDALRLCLWTIALPFVWAKGRKTAPLHARMRTSWKSLLFHLLAVDDTSSTPHTVKCQLFVRFSTAVSLIYYLLWVLPLTLARRLFGMRSRDLVILYYHGVRAFERAEFARQMDVLVRAGRPVMLDYGEDTRGPRALAVTFDDAFANVPRNALPELARRGIACTIFVPSGSLGGHAKWPMREGSPDRSERLMSADELRSLGDLVRLASHTSTHRRLADLSDDEAAAELSSSRLSLESALGKRITEIAFPHGSYNKRIAFLAREAGYKRAYSIECRTSRQNGQEFVRGRFWGDLDSGRLEHWLKVRGAFAWIAPLQRLKKRLARRKTVSHPEASEHQ